MSWFNKYFRISSTQQLFPPSSTIIMCLFIKNINITFRISSKFALFWLHLCGMIQSGPIQGLKKHLNFLSLEFMLRETSLLSFWSWGIFSERYSFPCFKINNRARGTALAQPVEVWVWVSAWHEPSIVVHACDLSSQKVTVIANLRLALA